jgi:hypothetical protein
MTVNLFYQFTTGDYFEIYGMSLGGRFIENLCRRNFACLPCFACRHFDRFANYLEDDRHDSYPFPLAGAGWQFFDNNGVVLAGGKLYTYDAGTTTLRATYTDSTGATPNSNPIVLDSAGRVPNEVWLTRNANAGVFTQVFTDSVVSRLSTISLAFRRRPLHRSASTARLLVVDLSAQAVEGVQSIKFPAASGTVLLDPNTNFTGQPRLKTFRRQKTFLAEITPQQVRLSFRI